MKSMGGGGFLSFGCFNWTKKSHMCRIHGFKIPKLVAKQRARMSSVFAAIITSCLVPTKKGDAVLPAYQLKHLNPQLLNGSSLCDL